MPPSHNTTQSGVPTTTMLTDHSSFKNSTSLDDEVIQQHQEEKNLIKYRQPPPGLFKQLNKSLWGLVDHINWARMAQICCVSQNYLEIAPYFDVMGWWKVFAKRFPPLFPSAIIALSKPCSNAFQERVFSTLSWFDSNKLMQNQLNKTFKMRTLDRLTREVREQIKSKEAALQKAKMAERGLVGVDQSDCNN